MGNVLAYPAAASPVAIPLVIDAARYWRIARDARRHVQPALHARLAPRGIDMMAPALDGLLGLFEACFRRRFRAGAPQDTALTADEQRLLSLLAGEEKAIAGADVPTLIPAIRIALRSTRMILETMLAPIRKERSDR